MSDAEKTLAALDEAVRGKEGLQTSVADLRTTVRDLVKFRDTIIGVQIAVGVLSPILAHFLLT